MWYEYSLLYVLRLKNINLFMPTYYITTLNFAIPFFITLIALEIFFLLLNGILALGRFGYDVD